MPSVVMLSVVMLSVIMLSVFVQSVMLSVSMMNIILLSVIMLNAIMLSVVAPDKDKEKSFTTLLSGSAISGERIFRFQNRSGASVIKHFAAVIYDHLPLAGLSSLV
jgi:hypothetical protein